jgi:tetratricopeptide (TPR) repeat protein
MLLGCALFRALVKMELHDNAGAEADLNSALSLAPDDPNALTNLGALQMKRGQLEQAADSFQKALRFAPHDPEIRCNVALALYRLDLNEAALETLRRDTRAIHLWEANGRPQVPPRLSLVFYLVIAASAIAMAVFVAWRLNSTL